MIRLRLPRAYPLAPTVPVFVGDEAEPLSALLPVLGRRRFLQVLALVVGFVTGPRVGARRVWARARGRFFTRTERRTLDAMVDRVMPPDADPGGSAMGAVTYIERLLTAFDRPRIRFFARGPFSGRNPFPDPDTGTPSRKRPRNDFKRALSPTRLQTLRWRAEVFGSAAGPEVAALDAQFGAPLVGWRDIYREGLATLDRIARERRGSAFADLSPDDQDALLTELEPDGALFPRDPRRGETFFDVVIGHTIEACFSAPEYGGNRRLAGWRLAGFAGDSQPLGYAIFSTETGTYHERPEAPLSTPSPEDIGPGGVLLATPLTADGTQLRNLIAALGDVPACPV